MIEDLREQLKIEVYFQILFFAGVFLLLGYILGHYIFPPKVDPNIIATSTMAYIDMGTTTCEWVVGHESRGARCSKPVKEISIISEKKKCDEAGGDFSVFGQNFYREFSPTSTDYMVLSLPFETECTLKTPDKELFNYKVN